MFQIFLFLFLWLSKSNQIPTPLSQIISSRSSNVKVVTTLVTSTSLITAYSVSSPIMTKQPNASQDRVSGTTSEPSRKMKRDEHSNHLQSLCRRRCEWSARGSWSSSTLGVIPHHLRTPAHRGVIASGLLWIIHPGPLPLLAQLSLRPLPALSGSFHLPKQQSMLLLPAQPGHPSTYLNPLHLLNQPSMLHLPA